MVPETGGGSLPPREEVMTLPEVAALLHLEIEAMYHRIQRGSGPPGRRVGRRWLYLRSEVEEWLRAGGDSTEPRRLGPRRKPVEE